MPHQLQNLANLAERPPQPWSKALLRALCLQARRSQTPLRTIEPHQLELLLIAQDFRCAFTGRRLILPDEDELARVETYGRWLDSLSPANYRQAAALTRFDSNEPWQQGNLVFLCAPWAVLHSSFSDLADGVLEIRTVADRLSAGQVAVLPAGKYYVPAVPSTTRPG